MSDLTIGYHLIRGLGAPLRSMCYYTKQPFTNACYGNDMKDKWFGEAKPGLVEKNSCMNLPYIVDGDQVFTQSNTCLLYLGKKLGIDTEANFFHNHTVLDQTMDLRNDLMKVVYPFGSVKTKEEFPEAAKKHLESAKGHFTKLNGFCKGPYMCGAAIQSGDFHVFEMIDQHVSIAAKLGLPSPLEGQDKLSAFYETMKADPNMAAYLASDCHTKYAQNNGLITHYTGQGDDFVYGPSVTNSVTF